MNKKTIKVKQDKDKGFKFYFHKPFEEILEDLKNHVEHLEDTNQYLREKIEKLENFNKDEEIEKYKQTINDLREYSLYILDEEQKQQMKEFREKHYKECKCSYYDIILSPNEIFTAVKIKCSKCNEELDLSMY